MQYKVGWSIIAIVGFNVMVNLTKIVYSTSLVIKKWLRKNKNSLRYLLAKIKLKFQKKKKNTTVTYLDKNEIVTEEDQHNNNGAFA